MEDAYELRIILREDNRIEAAYFLKEKPSNDEIFALILSFVNCLTRPVTAANIGVTRCLFSLKFKKTKYSNSPSWSFYKIEGRQVQKTFPILHKHLSSIPSIKEFLTHDSPAIRNIVKKYLKKSKNRT